VKVGRAIHAWPKWAAALAVALASFALAVFLREAGALEKLELGAYDHFLATRATGTSDDRIGVILETEADLQRYGHPLPDEVLATLLERILAVSPLAVAMDKYRDIPVAPGSERLAALLAKNDRVFWVRKLGDERNASVKAPRGVEGTPFAACGDVVADADGRVRRQLAYVDDGQGPCYSLGFAAARRVLEAGKVKVGFDKAGDLLVGARRFSPLDPGDGPYATADMAGFQLPVEYGAAPRVATLSDVLDGRFPAEAFRGRAVFFGSSAESLRDFFPVPVAARGDGLMNGVEVHAQAAASLLRAALGTQPPLRLAERWSAYILAAIAALAVGAGLIATVSWSSAAIVTAAAALACYVVSRIAIGDGLFLSCVPALAAVGIAGFLGFAMRARREQAERGEMLGLFSRQVSKEVADAIWAERELFYRDGHIPTRELVATVFFLDIRSFTTVTEKLGAGTVPWLNRGLGAMTDIVLRNRGVVTRFVGDQIMAVYGVPVPRADDATIRRDARSAVQTAIEIGQRLDAVNVENTAEGLPPIRVRIGINTGNVTQGAVGSSLRFEFTVLGDAVNTAARLESYATEDDGASARVLIGESTYRLCGEHFRCEPLGALNLKGKVETVNVYRVHGVATEGTT